MEAKIQLVDGGQMPTKATADSAGWDLYAAESVVLNELGVTPVSVGFRIALPSDMEMQIRSRSGLSIKGVTVANSPGTVDADFRGTVKVLLRYVAPSDRPEHTYFQINKGDRIAQAVFAWVPKLTLTETDTLDATARGEGGFGSTGK